MTKHNHAVCEAPARRPSTIVNILSSWHFDFPRQDAISLLKEHYQCYRDRAGRSALATAQAIITAEATKEPDQHVHGVLRETDHLRVMIYWIGTKTVSDIWSRICCVQRALEFAPTSKVLRGYIWIDDIRAPAHQLLQREEIKK